MNTRISQVRKAVGITQEKFAEKIGLTRNFVWMIEKGERIPSDRTIADICRTFNVSEVWLRTGEGEMFNQLDEDAEFICICEQINITDPIIKRIIKAYWGLDEQEKAAIRKLIDRFVQDGKSP